MNFIWIPLNCDSEQHSTFESAFDIRKTIAVFIRNMLLATYNVMTFTLNSRMLLPRT